MPAQPDHDHLLEFYVGRSLSNRDRVFGDGEDFDFEPKQESLDTQLNQIFLLGRSKLFYHFDFGESRKFAISLAARKQPVVADVEYPRLVESEGANPPQHPVWDDE